MNPLLTEIAKPLTERKPWPWHRLEDGHLGRRVGNVNTVVPTLYEAEKIQALEDQPRLIAEVGRLQEQTDEYEGVIVQLESEVTRLQSQADEAASKLGYFQHKSVADSIRYDTGADDAFRECEAIVKEITLEMAKGFTETPRSFTYSGEDIVRMFGNIADQFESRIRSLRESVTEPSHE